ncbi:hypothetical protein HDU83_000873 [Entophlyctis luteolus]|nr:hypothetical protein HDU83_000873 [Entophlyctis luteolus]
MESAINFAEFIHAISVTARGSETEKLEMAFRLYDRDGDGMISGEEMRRVAAEVHNMAGPTAGKVDEKAARRINRLLAGMDKEQRGKIDKNAFVETMLREPEVRDALDMLAKVRNPMNLSGWRDGAWKSERPRRVRGGKGAAQAETRRARVSERSAAHTRQLRAPQHGQHGQRTLARTWRVSSINQWFSDLSYYESTLEQMAASKLDDSFREELRAIEQWFVVLSDPERTAALYSLIKHTTPMQQRFFITVLQQLSGKDISSVPTTTTPQITTTFVKHSSTPAPVKGTDMDLLTIATGNSLRLSLEPKTPVDAAIAQADWSQQPTPQLSTDPVRLSPIIQPRTFSAHPGDGWAHVNLASTGRSVSKGAVSGSDFSDYDEFGHVNGSTGTGAGASGKEKGKIPENLFLTDTPP